jgi:transcriptional regulator with XRE-family HTH domain
MHNQFFRLGRSVVAKRRAAAKSKKKPGRGYYAGLRSAGEGIGARIRFLRHQRKMTLELLSASSKLTKSFVSKIERGLSVPSISAAMRLSEAFKITVSQLLGEDHYDDAISLVRRKERRSFMGPGSSSGYNYEMLAGPKRFKRMEPYVMRPPLKFQDKRRFEHVGEELMFVLSGGVEVEISGQSIQLRPGDALYFDSHLPHRSRSLGGKYAEVLVVITQG